MDGLRVPENAFPKQRIDREHPTWAFVEPVALASYQLPGDRYSSRCLLGAIFSRVHVRYDGNARADRMGLHQYEKRIVSASHPYKFHRRTCRVYYTTCDSRTR